MQLEALILRGFFDFAPSNVARTSVLARQAAVSLLVRGHDGRIGGTWKLTGGIMKLDVQLGSTGSSHGMNASAGKGELHSVCEVNFRCLIRR